jgi:hypothetical protein
LGTVHRFLGDSGKVDKVTFRADIEQLGAGPKVIHHASQGSRRNRPVMDGPLGIELGVDCWVPCEYDFLSDAAALTCC